MEALAEEMLTPLTSDVEGVTIHQFHGEDAMGVIVNGEYMDEAPVWSDLLPEFHQAEDVEEEDLPPDPLPSEWDQEDEFNFEDGHSVVTGGNLAINEVSATVAWVDAPYIAVGGQSIGLTMISQVAVASDYDKAAPGAESGTKIVQTSEIKVEGQEAPWLADNADGEGQPAFLVVDWIYGDLIVSNFVQQVIDATDIDHIQTEISASTTLYAMGDNEMVNVTDIVQLGSYYDLIMIDGDMISVDMLLQTLVLLDDDVIDGGIPSASDGADENLLMNQASVTTIGEDTQEKLEDAMADAMTLTEGDMAALEEALLNDPMFAGMEQMRVLKIDGSLLQVNVFRTGHCTCGSGRC